MPDAATTRAAVAASTIALTADDVRVIRTMLLNGLACFGELQRLENAAGIRDITRTPVPDDLRPNDPIGDLEAVSRFVDALMRLEVGRA